MVRDVASELLLSSINSATEEDSFSVIQESAGTPAQEAQQKCFAGTVSLAPGNIKFGI
jgi:hypothetical protein